MTVYSYLTSQTFSNIVTLDTYAVVYVAAGVSIYAPNGGFNASSGNQSFDIEGHIFGFYAIQMISSGSSIKIGLDGSVVEFACEGILATGNSYITNNGVIESISSASNNVDCDGVAINEGTLNNYGTISADEYGVVISGSSSQLATLYNYGSINGVQGGIFVTNVKASSVIYNSGAIDAGAGYNGVNSGGAVTLTNSGTISGGVYAKGAGSSVTDSGTINNGLYIVSASGGFTTIAIDSTGVVNGTPGYDCVQIGAGGFNIVNAGTIAASQGAAQSQANAVTLHSAGAVTNSGAISSDAGAGVLDDDASLTDTTSLANSGSISGTSGGVILDDSASIDNSGQISGGGAGGLNVAGTATLTNEGKISGGVTIGGAGASVTDSGTIIGGVTISGAGASLKDSGTISGGVTISGAGAPVKDSGTINDGLSVASASGGFTNVTIDSAGVVNDATGYDAVEIGAGAYTIANSGTINALRYVVGESTAYGVAVHSAGILTNSGAITSNGGDGVSDDDSSTKDVFTLDNSGVISGSFFGVNIQGSASVTDSGTINGGLYTGAGFSAISIAATGAINGLRGGNALEIGTAAYWIANAGTIIATGVSATTATAQAVALHSAGTLTNSGAISSSGGEGVSDDDTSKKDTFTLDNSGAISGTGGGVVTSGAVAIDNSGSISGGGWGGVYVSGSATLVNSGTIDNGVAVLFGGTTIDDSGTIDGGLFLVGTYTTTDNVYIRASGALTNAAPYGAAMTIGGCAYVISNAGQIDAISIANSVGTTVNTGNILSIADSDAFSNDTSYLYNLGTITGGVSDTGAHTAFIDNVGTINGGAGGFGVFCSTNVEDLYNSGTILGGISINGSGASLLVNSGAISGGVYFTGATLDSTYGTISGLVNLSNGSGHEVIAGQTGGTVSGGSGNDILYANPTLAAANNAAKTILDGGAGTNFLFGDGAYTTFVGGDAAGGLDVMIGGASQMAGVSGYANNTLSYASLAAGTSAYVNLAAGFGLISSTSNAATGSLTYEDYLSNILNVIGSSGGDQIVCDSGIDRITGGGGADYLYAGSGAASQDTFVYTSLSDSDQAANDWIVGFKEGVDKIDLSALGLGSTHLAIQDSGIYHTIILEQTAGTFNPATDLFIGVQTTTATALAASNIVF